MSELSPLPGTDLERVRVSSKLLHLMDLKSRGLSNRQIADMMQTSYPHVLQLQNSEKFKKMWAKACENAANEVRDRLAALSVHAVDTVDEMMKPPNPARVRLNAAQDVLDRAGFGVRKEQVNQFQVRIESEQMNVILGVARELGTRPVTVLDAGNVQRKPVLSGEGSAGPQQVGEPSTQGDVRPPAAAEFSKDPDTGSTWFLQNYDWRRGVSDLETD